MVVGRGGDDCAQQRSVEMHATDDRTAKEQEVQIVVRRAPRIEEIALRGVTNRPVHVLARAVETGEGLLMKQADEAVLQGGGLHRRHHQLLMIGCDVRSLEVRRQFELPWRDLVVMSLGRDAEPEELVFKGLHEDLNALRNRAEVVVIEFLALGRWRTEECTSGEKEVGSAVREMGVDEKILLLRAAARVQRSDVRLAHQAQHLLRGSVHRRIRPEQRDLLVESLTGPRHEDARNHERRTVWGLHDVDRTRRVPGSVPARGRCHAQAAVRKRRTIGLTLDEKAPGKLGDGVAIRVGHDEAIVLLRCDVRHGVEDVREELHALAERPILHGSCDDVRRRRVERSTRMHRLLHFLEGLLRKGVLHGCQIEDVAGPDLA